MLATRYALSAALISLILAPKLASAQSFLDVSTYGATSTYGDTMRKGTSQHAAPAGRHVALAAFHSGKPLHGGKTAAKSGKATNARVTRHK